MQFSSAIGLKVNTCYIHESQFVHTQDTLEYIEEEEYK